MSCADIWSEQWARVCNRLEYAVNWNVNWAGAREKKKTERINLSKCFEDADVEPTKLRRLDWEAIRGRGGT